MDKLELDKLLEKEWVIQSCEASQWLFYAPFEASLVTLKERYGAAYDLILTYVEDGFGYAIYESESAERLARLVVAREEDSPGSLAQAVGTWKKDQAVLLAQCRRLDGIDLAALTDAQLQAQFAEFYRAHLYGWGISMFCDAFGIFAEKMVTEQLSPLLESRGETGKFSRYLPVLTAPVTPSFAAEESIGLLGLAAAARETPQIAKALQLEPAKRIPELKKHPAFYRALSAHSKKYFWIRNSYLKTHYLNEEYFATAIAEALSEKVDTAAKINSLQGAPIKSAQEKKALIVHLGVKGKLALLLNMVEAVAALMDERKKTNFIGDHYAMLFLDELCRRRGYRKDDWLALSPHEFADALAGKIDAAAMAVRSHASLMVATPAGIEFVAGEPAREFFKQLSKETHGEVSDVRGTCASPGRVEGSVRIIKTTADLPKMKKGDVLVSGMTRPELVPAMKKAVAIVTDEGGITSHAAIVSRELGIPCVIGTKIATKVFSDGDFVEVNANHGVVRKIERVSK